MKKSVLIFSIAAGILLSGCSSFKSLSRALFTNTSLADVELKGISRGCVPITAAIAGTATSQSSDPRLALVTPLLSLALEKDPIGCVLQVERIGEINQPFYVLCTDHGSAVKGMAAKCQSIPLNQAVVITGQPLGPGGMIIPTRVAWNE